MSEQPQGGETKSRGPAGSIELEALIAAARASGDHAPLIAAIPAARFLGITAEPSPGASGESSPRAVMRFRPHLVGNSLIPALHGGAIGALLESTAVFALLLDGEAAGLPKIVNLTVEYLRSAKTVDTYARAEITRQGRRVATVRAYAWQDDPDRPVAAANAHFLVAGE
jgi:uncharacterized protein (TIGR00369 family)